MSSPCPPRWLHAVTRRANVLLPWVSGAAGTAMLVWVLWRIDYAAFRATLANANLWLVALVPVAILFEQWVAAAKWTLLLAALGGARLSRVFAASMAATLAGYVVPAVGSAVARCWLVARCEGLKFTPVLASVAVNRTVDAAALVCFAIAALLLVGLPQSSASLHTGIIAGVAGASVVLAVFVALLMAFRRSVQSGVRGGEPGGGPVVHRLLSWLPARWRERARRFVDQLAEGIAWPRNAWRASAIVFLAFCIKALAATNLMWAGLALGVPLGFPQYVLLMVLLGFVVVLARFVRIPGSFLLAATFLLELYGVDRERALAMALIVQVSAIVSVTAVAAVALTWFGAELRELKAAHKAP